MKGYFLLKMVRELLDKKATAKAYPLGGRFLFHSSSSAYMRTGEAVLFFDPISLFTTSIHRLAVFNILPELKDMM
jgi:hypothetical protein